MNNAASSGVGVSADFGFSNDDAGGGNAVGATASMGLGPLGVSATIARSSSDEGDSFWSQGVSGSMMVFGAPLMPFKVTVQAGVAFWDRGALDGMHVPISLGLAANIPFPVFAIRPWLAPRIDIQRETLNGAGQSATNFGISGGIELGFVSGLAIRASYDRLSVDGASPSILSLGVGFALGR